MRFGAESQAEVDRIAKVATTSGARNIEGPMDYEPGYYAVFFEDPTNLKDVVLIHSPLLLLHGGMFRTEMFGVTLP